MLKLNWFVKILNEMTGHKQATVVYCHMNPLTPVEIRLMREAHEHSNLNNTDLVIFTPERQESTRNPLSFEQKLEILDESFGLSELIPVHSLREGLSWLDDMEYKDVYFFIPEECVENLCHISEQRSFNYEIIESYPHNDESRDIILESTKTRNPFVAHQIQNPQKYAQLLSESMKIGLFEEYSCIVSSGTELEVGGLYENLVNGDIVNVVGVNGNHALCESWFTGTPEIYNKSDLVYSGDSLVEIACDTKPIDFMIDEMIGTAIENDVLAEIFDSFADATLNLKYGAGSTEGFLRIVKISDEDSIIIKIKQLPVPPEMTGGKQSNSVNTMRIDFSRVQHKDIGGDLVTILKSIDMKEGMGGVIDYVNNLLVRGVSTAEKTGLGNQFKIFSSVIKAGFDYARKIKPKYIMIAGSREESSRIHLYQKLIRKLTKSEPVEVEGTGIDAENRVFVAKVEVKL